MKNKYFWKIVASLFVILIMRPLVFKGQGCSDAGVCSVGSLSLVQFKYELLPSKENKLQLIIEEDTKLDTSSLGRSRNTNDSLLRKFEYETSSPSKTDSIQFKKTEFLIYSYKYPKYFFLISTTYGEGDNGTSIIVSQIEANLRLKNEKTFAQIKLPYTFISGKLGSINGLGDITISATHIMFSESKSSLSFSGGFKIPTNKSNRSLNNLPLPMVYQTSLGTTDILLGAKYTFKKWDGTIGYQHSFDANNNQYVHQSGVEDPATYNSFFESKILRRADDAIFRINRNFIGKKINFSTGLLFIYHLKDDMYSDSKGKVVTAIGSKGLTLNINLAGTIALSKKVDFVFIYANPIVTRKSRPDGLTRKYIFQIGFKYNIF